MKLQALILCGGIGERLKPITEKIPKPLVMLNNEPILGHQLIYLQSQGIKDFILATGYKSKLIEDYIAKSFNYLNIKIVNSGDVDIIYRIRDCKPHLNDEFLVCYGDTLANINIIDLYNFHNNNNAISTVSSYQIQSQFGILNIDKNGLVNGFMEKPKLDAWINIGFFIFNKKVFNIKAKNFADLIAQLAHSGYLYSFKHKGLHITVNTLTELKQAEKDIKIFS